MLPVPPHLAAGPDPRKDSCQVTFQKQYRLRVTQRLFSLCCPVLLACTAGAARCPPSCQHMATLLATTAAELTRHQHELHRATLLWRVGRCQTAPPCKLASPVLPVLPCTEHPGGVILRLHRAAAVGRLYGVHRLLHHLRRGPVQEDAAPVGACVCRTCGL